MRLVTLTLSVTLSAALLSGCSFITGQSGQYKNPFAKANSAQQGQYHQASAAQHCQIATPRQPIPRGCRPEQVTIGVRSQGQAFGGPNYGINGFPQQPQFGQPQYTDGAYGSAVGQTAALSYHTPNSKKRKPKLRGSLSIGVEKSLSGDIVDPRLRGLIGTDGAYNPQVYNEGSVSGSQADGLVTTTRYTANDLDAANIFAPFEFETADVDVSKFHDAWSTPTQIRGGLEYVLNDKMTVFANGGYTYAQGEGGDAISVDATLYRQVSDQAYIQDLDAAGEPIPGSYSLNGAPVVNTSFVPNQNIATIAYEFSDLEQYDLEVGARHYFNPLVKSHGYRTVTPFVGASVGVSRVNAVDVSISQSQAFYRRAFEGTDGATTYSVPTADDPTRLYDAQWLPQGQLNVGAEWQITPGFALAAETGVKVQGAREYADFTNAAGEIISGAKGDTNISVPLTLRGSVNF